MYTRLLKKVEIICSISTGNHPLRRVPEYPWDSFMQGKNDKRQSGLNSAAGLQEHLYSITTNLEDKLHSHLVLSRCFLIATAFLIRWYRSSGISGARPLAFSTRRTLLPVTKRTWATPWLSRRRTPERWKVWIEEQKDNHLKLQQSLDLQILSMKSY